MALPSDHLLKGAALSPSGDLVAAWFAENSGIRAYGGSAPRDLLVEEIGRAVGVEFLTNERFEIVDVASGEVVTADTAGVEYSRRDLRGSRQASAAVRTGTGWILAISDSNSTPSHVKLPQWSGTWTPDSTYTWTLGLSRDRKGALVWQSFSPFRAWRIGVEPEWTSEEFEPVSADWFGDNGASLRESPAIWSVTSVIAVGPGYVKTLANRGTDDRLLIWFDKDGQFRRSTSVTAPFGFVAAAAEAPVVLAMRTLNDSELVKYSWERVPGATLEHKEVR